MKRGLWGVLAGLLTLASCSTFDQKVNIAPLKTPFPVSASSSLLVGDKTIGGDQFVDTQAFSLSKTIRVPLSVGKTDLGLSSLLDQELKGTSYNAVTNLKVEVTTVNKSVTGWVVAEQNLGLVLVGASVFGWFGLIYQEGQPGVKVDESSYRAAEVVFWSGLAMFPLSIIHSGFGTVDYTFDVSGLKVRY
jgi:hypothetical protein